MDNLISIMEEIGIPYAYDHFAEGESPEPPFVCFLCPGSDNFAADGWAYFKVVDVICKYCTCHSDLIVVPV